MDKNIQPFPQNCYEAIAMLYVEQQASKGYPPEELIRLYWETLDKVHKTKI